MASIVSINVGRPRTIERDGRAIQTAMWKTPVAGRVRVGRLNIEGDAQADLKGHGGEQRAVLVYQIESYRHWAAFIGRAPFPHGMFGENLTIEGLSDEEVCVGDRLEIGSALFEVTQPRVTCFKLGIKLDRRDMPALLVAHRRPGFYLRVIEEGEIGAGDTIVRAMGAPNALSIADIDALLYSPDHDEERLRQALRLPALSPGWRASFRALLSAAENGTARGNAGLSTTRRSTAWSGYRQLKVAAIHEESEGIKSFEFVEPSGHDLPTPLPGQYVGVRVHPSAQQPTVVRNYSLCGPPTASSYRIAVKNEHGAASRFLHEAVSQGGMIEVSAPRGDFVLQARPGPIVLLSAGIGVTPLLAMLHAARGEGALEGRSVWWVHVARNRRNHPFAAEVEDLLDGTRLARRIVFYSRPDLEDRLGTDYDFVGRTDIDRLRAIGLPLDAQFYMCGPSSYLDDIRASLSKAGVDERRLHAESFGPTAATLQARPHPPAGSEGTGPRITFARSGLSVAWNPAFASLLDLAEACSVPVNWSCRTGVCHRCETGLIDGRVRYDPDPIDPPPSDAVLLCCASPAEEITLDL